MKGTRTRRRIMETTAKMMAHRSFADVRISDIAREAEIAQPNFYTYFESVEDVIRALAEEVSFEPLASHLEPDWSEPGGLDLARRLVRDAFELWKEHHAVLTASSFLADKRHSDFPQLRVRQARSLYKAFEEQIRRSQAAGRIASEVQPRLAGYQCFGLVSAAASRHSLFRESGFTQKQLLETNARLLHAIVTGTAVPPGTQR